MTTYEQQIEKQSKDIIISEMIDCLTTNTIIREASNKSLLLTPADYTGKLLTKKFTARVSENMPQIKGDFDFGDSPESIARDEFMKIANIIDRATDNELTVIGISQIYK